MLPDRVSNPGPLTYESGALPIAQRGPAHACGNCPSFRIELLVTVNLGYLKIAVCLKLLISQTNFFWHQKITST